MRDSIECTEDGRRTIKVIQDRLHLARRRTRTVRGSCHASAHAVLYAFVDLLLIPRCTISVRAHIDSPLGSE
jgi:hypothetical protein